MKINLATVSLAEILSEIGKKKLSRCLFVKTNKPQKNIYIWCWQGNLVSVTGIERIEAKLLLYDWISLRLSHAINGEKLTKPLGEKLLHVYGISTSQLQQLFQEQLSEILPLISTNKGFVFSKKIENENSLPWVEMTGIRVDILMVVKQGLTDYFSPRYLEFLPEGTLAIKFTDNRLNGELEALELKILKYANTNKTIARIAKELKEPKLIVQKTVYILELIGLVEKTLTSNKIIELTQNFILDNSPTEELTSVKNSWKKPLSVIAASNVILVCGLFLGLFQDLERGMLDRFFRWRGTQKNHDITIVTIDDTDINKIQDYPIGDRILARTITNLKKYNPTVIGVDLYRDIPQNPGHEELLNVYRSTPNLVGVEKIIDNSVSPPPILAERGQVGFSDLIIDNDGVLRRALMSLEVGENDYRLSLGTHLGLFFLDSRGIQMSQIESNRYSIGEALLQPLSNNSGGYWREDLGGIQVLLNYQSQIEDFEQISLWDAYHNRINPESIEDRIVIIGTIADSKKDYVSTPFSRQSNSRRLTSGVVIHANVAAQLIDAAFDERPLLKVWTKGREIAWLITWSVIGMLFGLFVLELNFNSTQNSKPWAFSLKICGLLLLATATGYLAFLAGWWIPILTPFIAALISFNITSLQYQKELKNLIYLDKLTKVFNRHYFNKLLEREFTKAKQSDRELVLIFCRLENLTGENTPCDPQKKPKRSPNSDRYLIQTAKKIARSIVAHKIIARYDFNTFAILLPNIDRQKAKLIANQLKDLFEKESKSYFSDRSDPREQINYQLSWTILTSNLESTTELIAAAKPFDKDL